MKATLPRQPAAEVISRQVLRSATAVAANYREACRARSDAELLSKLGIVEQELDETHLWFELLVESDLVEHRLLEPLMTEADELLKMVVTAIKSTRANQERKQ